MASIAQGAPGVNATEPLPLHHSWPLLEQPQRFGLGHLFDCPRGAMRPFAASREDQARLAAQGVGLWECDLADDSLRWTDTVHDLFGLPRGNIVARRDAVRMYAPDCGFRMERLRAYAIKHRRGFTLDVAIRPGGGAEARVMRLIAAPVIEQGRTIALRGLKIGL